ncbi:MAG: ABC transporter ATP-binding protein, partial [Olsenella sp.]|nr:ABC transporter ATP-binding protein [Olsenella sp.]
GAAGGIDLAPVVWTLFALAVARGVLHYAEQRTNHYIAFRLLAHVRDLVFGSLRRLAPAKLAGTSRGELVSTVTADVELLEVFFAHTVSPVAIALVTSGVMVAWQASVHPALALVSALAYAAVGVVVPLATSAASGDAGRQARDQAAGLSGFVLDGLRGLSEVTQFSAGARRLEELDRRSRELSGVQAGLSARAGTSSAATTALIMCFSAAGLSTATALARAGAVAPASAALSAVALVSSFGPVTALAALGSTLQGTLAAGERVLSILDEKPVVAEVEAGADPGPFAGAAAEAVTFSYGPTSADATSAGPAGKGERVLDDVSVNVAPGEVVGICGRSGSGKSTLLRLLMRFWDVDSGSVTISGEDVRGIPTATLRETEALVEQETMLFHDSIRDNLLIARPDATEEELVSACRAASVHDFIESLPDGYDTMVGELGDTLSGRERQRLGLARAFLHDAPLLLLDEPTSNLDALNEGEILRSLEAERGRRAVVLVSHRPSTMAIADRTYSMDSGRVS